MLLYKKEPSIEKNQKLEIVKGLYHLLITNIDFYSSLLLLILSSPPISAFRPSREHEILRRRVQNDVRETWFYLHHQLGSLSLK